VIRVSQVTKSYFAGQPNEKNVLHGVDLHIAEGSTQFLLGGNGAGKTTLLRIISSLLPMCAGSVRVNGCDTDSDAQGVKQSIGFFSANTALYERLSGREFLEYFSMLYGISPELFQAKLIEMNELFKFGKSLDLRCSDMSSGQRQKFNIARSLLHDPPIYIMDEPTLGLDIESLAGILDFIVYQRARAKTLLIVTHNMEMVHKLGGQVAFLMNGRILHNLSVTEIMQQSGKDNLIDAYRYYAQTQSDSNL